jgi:hypothetical protein
MGDNTKMKLVEIGWAAWTEFLWLRTGEKWAVVKTLMNFRVPYHVVNFVASYETTNF